MFLDLDTPSPQHCSPALSVIQLLIIGPLLQKAHTPGLRCSLYVFGAIFKLKKK